jgi:hypothetical protein
MGCWLYEASEWGLRGYAGYEHERSILYETSGVLGEQERTELEARWREEFEPSWSPGFSYSSEGRIFTGEIARELHWSVASWRAAIAHRGPRDVAGWSMVGGSGVVRRLG